MQPKHIILETDQLGNLKNVPKLPPNKKIQEIFLVLDDINESTLLVNSTPANLVGKVQILGDIFDSVPETDWEILQ
ncbi:hypothetical protein IQE94_09955 [Synechocystis sp. PCC 7339]|uniref:hypothetical protein n=1 Tax=unclassified Synechocystis TaxID=2640012 RepID=UPI001BAEA7EB|nr:MULTISPECIES: hypothetical protein [unclassified Synechocystis]QUS59308.1 hypothetical protein HTZ78_00445 [Synechocystis sp. PCC 7338]UAJ71494.1 hypothetical protein IQE94_09955 [Synechocystis sp. PCC 7339]